jgi:hypothetical protein
MRKYIYPKGLVLGYFLESMANNGVEYSLKRGKGRFMRYFKNSKDEIVDVFGGAIRVSPDSIADLERAQEELQKKQQTELFYID